MDALVLGRMGVERTRLEDLVRAAGHSVNACHDRSWGCVGMNGDCPLDATGVDVAIAVAEPGGRFDAQGVACAFRARIPIVAVGATDADPVLEFVQANVPHGDESVICAIEAAAVDATRHREVVEDAIAVHVHPDETVTVSIERTSRSIDVLLVADADERRAAALADTARAAVRHYDPHVNVIDVSVIAPD